MTKMVARWELMMADLFLIYSFSGSLDMSCLLIWSGVGEVVRQLDIRS